MLRFNIVITNFKLALLILLFVTFFSIYYSKYIKLDRTNRYFSQLYYWLKPVKD